MWDHLLRYSLVAYSGLKSNIYEVMIVVPAPLLQLLRLIESWCIRRRWHAGPVVNVAVGRCFRVAMTTDRETACCCERAAPVERGAGAAQCAVDVQAARQQEREAGRRPVPLVHLLDGAGQLRPADETGGRWPPAWTVRRRRWRPVSVTVVHASQRLSRTNRWPYTTVYWLQQMNT